LKLEVLEIRHHGVGSAKNVLARLKELEPDFIIIEGREELMQRYCGHGFVVNPHT